MTYVLAFLAYLLYVTLRALQQRQVQHAEYFRMPPVSYAMAFCDVFLMALVVKHANSALGLGLLALAMGTGSSIGSILGTWLHARKEKS